MALDARQARLDREKKKAQEAPTEQPLDPPFPHRRVYFDPFFFGVEREAPKPAKSLFPETL